MLTSAEFRFVDKRAGTIVVHFVYFWNGGGKIKSGEARVTAKGKEHRFELGQYRPCVTHAAELAGRVVARRVNGLHAANRAKASKPVLKVVG